MTAQLKPIAVVRSGEPYNAYDMFLQVLLKRRVELGIAGETLDDITGMPTRYSQKLLEGRKLFGRKSFGDMLGGLAVGIIIFEDREALDLIKNRLEQSPLDETKIHMQANASMCVPRWLFGPRTAREAGKKRWEGVSKKKHRRIARKAARKRWSTPRIVEVTEEPTAQKPVNPSATHSTSDSATPEKPNPRAQLASHQRK